MTSASQLPDLSNLPVADPASPLPGFVTFAHLAARVRTTPNHLRVILNQVDAPRIEPSYRIGGAHLYNEVEANAWLKRLQEWRDAAPLRAAARKKEQEQRVLLRLEQEQKQLRIQREILAGHQQAAAEFGEAKEAYLKEQGETNDRIAKRSAKG